MLAKPRFPKHNLKSYRVPLVLFFDPTPNLGMTKYDRI